MIPMPDSPENKCPERDYFYLCGNCGGIAPDDQFDALKYDDEGYGLIPAERHDQDPILRCPHCRFEHADDDSSPGLWDGSREAVTAERNKLQSDPIYTDLWEEAAKDGSGRINTSAEEARNQGDFLGDDLSGEHSCHAGCPCHSGPEVHINAPEELSDEDKRIVGDLVNRAAEKMQPDPQCPGLCDSEGELRARIEELAEKYEEVAALALGFASEKVSCSSVASDLRSLLVPKEEA